MSNPKIVLIDGHSILFRAFHGMPPMTSADGTPVNAVFGFLKILFKILDIEQPQYLMTAFDTSKPTFRHERYEAYKGTRKAAPPEFHVQEPIIRDILTRMEIPVIQMEGFEADDILGTVAKRAENEGMDVTLVSGDHDLLQIAGEKIKISIPGTRGKKTEIEDYYAPDVLSRYGVTPVQFIDVKALMGDSSDNIPGLPGVGRVTAEKLISAYGSIENAHSHLDEIKPNKAMEAMRDHYDLAVLSKDLATIRTDVPVEVTFEECQIGSLYTSSAREEFTKLGFKSLLDRFPEEEAIEPEEDFEIVTDENRAREIFKEAENEKACGLSFAWDKKLYAAALSYKGKTAVFDIGTGLPADDLLMLISKLISEGVLISSCDVKTARKLLGNFSGGNFFDAVIAAYLLDPLKSDHQYDDVSVSCLLKTLPSKAELVGKKGFAAAYEKDGIEKIGLLCGYEAKTAKEARKVLLEKLENEGMSDLFSKIEMPLTGVLASMECEGIKTDPDKLRAYGETLTGRIDELTASIYKLAGEEFNINSPRQLGEILFSKMGLPGGKKTKTGYSTAADVLEKLSPDCPIVEYVLEYRQLVKLKSTYADGLASFISEDGRIHTTFNQTVTATGRLSSADPNLQNIPMRVEQGRLIRKCFVPKDGCVFVDADYSQIELRILAHMSGDAKLIAAYRKEQDIHRITASQVFHTPFEEVTDLQRRNAKAVNFGIVYGISSFGLSQGLSITPKEAEKYIKDYFATYPDIKAFLDGLVSSAKEKGYAVSLFGRRRPIPELKASNFSMRGFGERAAMNSPIQGTAADIMKIAMNRVYTRLENENMKARLILQIHDELLVEAPAEEADKVEKILDEEMRGAASLSVELVCDCHQGADWYDAK